MSVRITNHSSKPSNYMVNVAWESADGSSQLDTSIATADHLEAGQNTTVDAISFKTAEGTFRCKVVDVTRYASN